MLNNFLHLITLLSLIDSLTPSITDLERFENYPRSLVAEACSFNLLHSSHLYKMQAMYPAQESIQCAIDDCKSRYKAWDLLRDAKTEYYNVPTRRQALGTLRETIGAEAYQMAVMPFPVDLRRFHPVR